MIYQAKLLLSTALVTALHLAAIASSFENGNDWSRWSKETQSVYVSAYLSGHARGFRDGCEVGQKTYSTGKLHGLPGEKCLPKAPNYSRQLEEYVTDVTNYYSAYPTDLHVPIFRVLDGLSDARKLTVNQMHDYYGSSSRRPQKP